MNQFQFRSHRVLIMELMKNTTNIQTQIFSSYVSQSNMREVMQIPPECLQIFQPLFRHIQLFIPGDTQTVLKTRMPSF
uniref:Uncharacterized protein n=1 Tax=Timema tahoe TaxID=61484 RepID=A0A7R9IGG4_9NEOP|nr:unnamed protein product [Timema tahoe]